jgi:hypothetical protein
MIGRGMGGYFPSPPGWKLGTTYVDYRGTKGRLFAHVGLLMPLLKGGIVLMAVYYLFFLRLYLPKGAQWNDVPVNFAARVVIAVYTLFLLIEGPPTLGDPLACLMVGLCCARAASMTGEVNTFLTGTEVEIPVYDSIYMQEIGQLDENQSFRYS